MTSSTNGKDAGPSNDPDTGGREIPAAKAPVETFDPPTPEGSRRIFQNGDTDRAATNDS